MSGIYSQPKITEDAMDVIRRAREEYPMGREQLAQEASEISGVSISFFEYRSMENGQTKNVPFHVVIACGIALGIPAHVLIPQLDT